VFGERSTFKQLVDAVDGKVTCNVSVQSFRYRYFDCMRRDNLQNIMKIIFSRHVIINLIKHCCIHVNIFLQCVTYRFRENFLCEDDFHSTQGGGFDCTLE
jgi:hypothetical protein